MKASKVSDSQTSWRSSSFSSQPSSPEGWSHPHQSFVWDLSWDLLPWDPCQSHFYSWHKGKSFGLKKNKLLKCIVLHVMGTSSSLWMRGEHHSVQRLVSFGFSPAVPNKNISKMSRNVHCQIRSVKSLVILKALFFFSSEK